MQLHINKVYIYIYIYIYIHKNHSLCAHANIYNAYIFYPLIIIEFNRTEI